MIRGAPENFHKQELFKSNSTTKCPDCNALFPLEYFTCPQCKTELFDTKIDFE